MIYGIGTDIIRIGRIEKAMQNPRFVKRFFSDAEYALFEARAFKPEMVALNYALKEAVTKAIGTGVRGFDLREVSIERDPLGKPILVGLGRFKGLLEALDIATIHLSGSHEKDYVVGFALAYRNNQ